MAKLKRKNELVKVIEILTGSFEGLEIKNNIVKQIVDKVDEFKSAKTVKTIDYVDYEGNTKSLSINRAISMACEEIKRLSARSNAKKDVAKKSLGKLIEVNTSNKTIRTIGVDLSPVYRMFDIKDSQNVQIKTATVDGAKTQRNVILDLVKIKANDPSDFHEELFIETDRKFGYNFKRIFIKKGDGNYQNIITKKMCSSIKDHKRFVPALASNSDLSKDKDNAYAIKYMVANKENIDLFDFHNKILNGELSKIFDNKSYVSLSDFTKPIVRLSSKVTGVAQYNNDMKVLSLDDRIQDKVCNFDGLNIMSEDAVVKTLNSNFEILQPRFLFNKSQTTSVGRNIVAGMLFKNLGGTARVFETKGGKITGNINEVTIDLEYILKHGKSFDIVTNGDTEKVKIEQYNLDVMNGDIDASFSIVSIAGDTDVVPFMSHQIVNKIGTIGDELTLSVDEIKERFGAFKGFVDSTKEAFTEYAEEIKDEYKTDLNNANPSGIKSLNKYFDGNVTNHVIFDQINHLVNKSIGEGRLPINNLQCVAQPGFDIFEIDLFKSTGDRPTIWMPNRYKAILKPYLDKTNGHLLMSRYPSSDAKNIVMVEVKFCDELADKVKGINSPAKQLIDAYGIDTNEISNMEEFERLAGAIKNDLVRYYNTKREGVIIQSDNAILQILAGADFDTDKVVLVLNEHLINLYKNSNASVFDIELPKAFSSSNLLGVQVVNPNNSNVVSCAGKGKIRSYENAVYTYYTKSMSSSSSIGSLTNRHMILGSISNNINLYVMALKVKNAGVDCGITDEIFTKIANRKDEAVNALNKIFDANCKEGGKLSSAVYKRVLVSSKEQSSAFGYKYEQTKVTLDDYNKIIREVKSSNLPTVEQYENNEIKWLSELSLIVNELCAAFLYFEGVALDGVKKGYPTLEGLIVPKDVKFVDKEVVKVSKVNVKDTNEYVKYTVNGETELYKKDYKDINDKNLSLSGAMIKEISKEMISFKRSTEVNEEACRKGLNVLKSMSNQSQKIIIEHVFVALKKTYSAVATNLFKNSEIESEYKQQEFEDVLEVLRSLLFSNKLKMSIEEAVYAFYAYCNKSLYIDKKSGELRVGNDSLSSNVGHFLIPGEYINYLNSNVPKGMKRVNLNIDLPCGQYFVFNGCVNNGQQVLGEGVNGNLLVRNEDVVVTEDNQTHIIKDVKRAYISLSPLATKYDAVNIRLSRVDKDNNKDKSLLVNNRTYGHVSSISTMEKGVEYDEDNVYVNKMLVEEYHFCNDTQTVVPSGTFLQIEIVALNIKR